MEGNEYWVGRNPEWIGKQGKSFRRTIKVAMLLNWKNTAARALGDHDSSQSRHG
jgi:hypothetical protein